MIPRHAKRYCRDDISKIENYAQAVADTTQIWHCHHRLEFTIDGEFAHSIEELKRLGMYYNRPYFELIFMTRSEHSSLHKSCKGLSEETRKRISKFQKGKTMSDNARQKISEARKGKTLTEEHRRKMSESHKGQTRSDDTRRKIAASLKARWARQEHQ